jgi:CheY-like chemotaxis protein
VQTVLIVEDDADVRRMFRTALTYEGFAVREASNGLDALRILDSALPDLVLLDLGLPVVNGYVVRQEIAANAHTRNIPIVVVTASAANHDHLKVACVLRKPVSPDKVVSAVRGCLAKGAPGIGS